MKLRKAAFVLQLAFVTTLAALGSWLASPPENGWLFFVVSELIGTGIIGILAASEGLYAQVSRRRTLIALLTMSVVMSIVYVMLYRYCVIRSAANPTWRQIPVYFPLRDPPKIAKDISDSGSRQDLVDQYGPASINSQLAKIPGITVARNLTSLLLLCIFQLAFVTGSVLASFWCLLILGGIEKRALERSLTSRFRVALSFPGEHRRFVAEVAEYLARKLGRDEVFYDQWYEAELARINLHDYLTAIYRDQSDLLVVFLCADYERKDWCRLEWGIIRELISTRREDHIMLIRVDEGDVSGVVSSDGYISVTGRSAREIADLILQRLAIVEGGSQS